MVLGQKRCAVGTFPNRQDMEYALNELNSAGFPIKQISLVAKDADFDVQLGRAGISDRVEDTASGAPQCAITLSMIGATCGCFGGLAGILAVPGVGPIIAVGTFVTTLAATLVGTGIGLVSGFLIDTLAGLETLEYQSQGEYLVIVDGTDDEVLRAESILSKSYSSKVWVC
jgi:uncharacterized membrane protein